MSSDIAAVRNAAARRYPRYYLGLLTVVYMCNFVDRQIINIVAEPVKRDLQLSDAQLGLLTGLVFAVFYTSLSLPVARLTERRHRPYILATCLTIWSGFTVACGFAQTFGQLLLGRVGVAVGESGCTPASHSLISDYFPRAQRARALAVLGLGSPIGGLVGLLVGGLVAGAYGWRVAFWVVGLPGLLLVPLVALTLYEPRRDRHASSAPPEYASLAETFKVLKSKPSFWLATFGSAGFAMFSLAEGAFIASFYLRIHTAELEAFSVAAGLPQIAFLGVALGLIMGVGGSAGSILGGVLADRHGAGSMSRYLLSPAYAALLLIPVHFAAMLVDSLTLSFLLLTVTAVLKAVFIGPTWATVQGVAPPHMRATASSIQLICNNLIGLGLGPVLVGVLSDFFAGPVGLGTAEGLRWSLIMLGLVCLPVFYLYWAARHHVEKDFHV